MGTVCTAQHWELFDLFINKAKRMKNYRKNPHFYIWMSVPIQCKRLSSSPSCCPRQRVICHESPPLPGGQRAPGEGANAWYSSGAVSDMTWRSGNKLCQPHGSRCRIPSFPPRYPVSQPERRARTCPAEPAGDRELLPPSGQAGRAP